MVINTKHTNISHSMFKLLNWILLAIRLVEQAQIKSYKLSPVNYT